MNADHKDLESTTTHGAVLPTVLLIQSELECSAAWRMLLDGDERFGQVTEARSSREAFDLLRREYSDVVILDVRMPGRLGIDVLDFLRSRYPMPIVVVVSTSNLVADLAIEHGASAFWTKVESVSSKMSEHLWRLWQQEATLCRTSFAVGKPPEFTSGPTQTLAR